MGQIPKKPKGGPLDAKIFFKTIPNNCIHPANSKKVCNLVSVLMFSETLGLGLGSKIQDFAISRSGIGHGHGHNRIFKSRQVLVLVHD